MQFFLRIGVSEPLFPAEIPEHEQGGDNENDPNSGVSPWVVEFGHEIKVHSVDPGEEGEREENGGDSGEDFHHFVHPLGEVGLVEFPNGGDGFAEVVGGFDGVPGVIVKIPDEGLERRSQQWAFTSLQRDGNFPHGADGPVKEIGLRPEVVNFLESDVGIIGGELVVDGPHVILQIVEG